MIHFKKLTRFQKICWIAALLWIALHTLGYSAAIISGKHSIDYIAADTKIYLDAAHALSLRAPMYDMGNGLWQTDQNYRYHPIFALIFALVSRFPTPLVDVVWMLILVPSYIVGIILWYRVVVKLQIPNTELLLAYLPLALIPTDWLGNLEFGNVGPLLVLISAVLVLLLLNKKPAWAGVLVAVLLVLKIYWAVIPLVLLFVFKDWKLLFKTIGWTLLAYGAITLIYVVSVGPAYGFASLRDYVVFLLNASRRFPWQGANAQAGVLNNAIYQTILRYFGFVWWAGPLTLLIQLSAGLAVLYQIWRAWQSRVSLTFKPEVALILAFEAYLVGILLLIQIEDVILGGFFFVLLWSFQIKKVRFRIAGYLIHGLNEFPTLISFATGIAWLYMPTAFPTALLGVVLLFWGSWTFTRLALRQSSPELLEQPQNPPLERIPVSGIGK